MKHHSALLNASFVFLMLTGCASSEDLETPINMTHLKFAGTSASQSFEAQFDLRTIYWGPEPMDIVLDTEIKNISNEEIVLSENNDAISVAIATGREYPIRPWHTSGYQGTIQPGESKEMTLKIQTKSLIKHVRKFQVDSVELKIHSVEDNCLAAPIPIIQTSVDS